jgi:hypothetical protein
VNFHEAAHTEHISAMETEKDYYKDLYNDVKLVVVVCTQLTALIRQGDSCVGKSCFITRLVNESFQQDYVATVRYNLLRLTLNR